MSRPRLFVELCAGLAAVSLRLQGGDRCRPPVSRQGSKAGYARAILGALGLHSGQGADGYLWCEPDNGCRALLQAYGQPDVLRAAADVIRDEWADEEPRALWERLRALGPIRGVDGREVARWVLTHRWAWSQRGPEHGYGGPGSKAGMMSQLSRDRALGCENTATRLTALPDLPPTVVGADARTVDPREVARWCFVHGNTRPGCAGVWSGGGGKGRPCNLTPAGISRVLTGEPEIHDRWTCPPLTSLRWPDTAIGADAREIDPPPLDGVVVFLDPPYQHTTGYAHPLPREEVLELARRWDRAGATVAISEQEPLTGWTDRVWSVDITAARKGQKRTFSKQQREWLSMNRAPVETPAEQIDLFAGVT